MFVQNNTTKRTFKFNKANTRIIIAFFHINILFWGFFIMLNSFFLVSNLSPVSASLFPRQEVGFIGEAEQDKAGMSLSDVGDVNNDDYDDFIIGASSNDEGGVEAGQTYLILGRPGNKWKEEYSLSESNASFIGENGLDFSGWSVSGAGDVNSDGYNDFVIGAPGFYIGEAQLGQVYLILGRPGDKWSMDTTLSLANASFIGEHEDLMVGSHVAGVGDVNNDGYDDFAIGGGNTTYVIFGKETNEWTMDVSLINADRFIIAGSNVFGVGDVNNDNYHDLAIGIPSDDDGGVDAGQTFLFFGRATSEWDTWIFRNEADASFIGEVADDYSGLSVSRLGDVNSDDYDDLLIGAPWNDEGGAIAGQTYLILGRATNKWEFGASLLDANASFIGEAASDESGWGISGVDDVNNDGLSDFVIGAFGNEDSAHYAGKTYLLLGKPTGQWIMDTSLSTADLSMVGEAFGDHLGIKVSGAKDVDNDGFDEFLVVAYFNDQGGVDAGKVYLILHPFYECTTIIQTTPISFTPILVVLCLVVQISNFKKRKS